MIQNSELLRQLALARAADLERASGGSRRHRSLRHFVSFGWAGATGTRRRAQCAAGNPMVGSPVAELPGAPTPGSRPKAA